MCKNMSHVCIIKVVTDTCLSRSWRFTCDSLLLSISIICSENTLQEGGLLLLCTVCQIFLVHPCQLSDHLNNRNQWQNECLAYTLSHQVLSVWTSAMRQQETSKSCSFIHLEICYITIKIVGFQKIRETSFQSNDLEFMVYDWQYWQSKELMDISAAQVMPVEKLPTLPGRVDLRVLTYRISFWDPGVHPDLIQTGKCPHMSRQNTCEIYLNKFT